MGKIGFTPIQNKVFSAFVKEPISTSFYFTGGTALSVFYLHHRESDDLDFFSEKEFENQKIEMFVNKISKAIGLPYRFTQIETVRIYSFSKGQKQMIKVDFVYYPHKRIEKGMNRDGMLIDGLGDIATNKLLTIHQRTEVKDFVDLYFLMRKYSLWDLLYGVEKKFGMEMDHIMVASNFLKVEQFDVLPKMLVPLNLKELQDFFRKQAIEIGKRITK